MDETERAQKSVERFQKQVGVLREEIGRVIVGNRGVVDGVLTCMLAGSHALLEGVPGLGKTMLVRTLAEAVGLDFSRIQFTPDLMPADIIGTTVIEETAAGGQRFEFRKGRRKLEFKFKCRKSASRRTGRKTRFLYSADFNN